jgi:hypothetical protein
LRSVPGAPLDTVDNLGDFFLDTRAEVLYGFKYHHCVKIGEEKQRSNMWPSTVTSLVGSKGDPAPPGGTGNAGPPGPVGPSHIYSGTQYSSLNVDGFQDTSFMDLSLPAGDHLVTATLLATNDDSSDQNSRANST